MEWALQQLTLWMNEGFPSHDRVAVPASPVGDHRGQRASGAPNGLPAGISLPSENATTPPMGQRAEGAPDGLWPPGTQLTLTDGAG